MERWTRDTLAKAQADLAFGDTGGVIDLGRSVFCDSGTSARCDAIGNDWTDRAEPGGFMFGSYAYCPWCAAEAEPRIRLLGEEWNIRSRCPDGMPFADWVRDVIRPAAPEGNTIQITIHDEEAAQ